MLKTFPIRQNMLRPLGLLVLGAVCWTGCAESPSKTIPIAASNWAKKYQHEEDKEIKDLEKLGQLNPKKPSLADAIFKRTEIFTAF